MQRSNITVVGVRVHDLWPCHSYVLDTAISKDEVIREFKRNIEAPAVIQTRSTMLWAASSMIRCGFILHKRGTVSSWTLPLAAPLMAPGSMCVFAYDRCWFSRLPVGLLLRLWVWSSGSRSPFGMAIM